MYDQFLRNSTNPLRTDLQSTMKAYSFEKERLVQQLSSLQSSDRSTSSTSMASLTDLSTSNGISPRRSNYFRAPNIAASSHSGSSVSGSTWKDGYLPPADKKWKEKRDAEKLKKEKDMLKLPVIHSARQKRTEWESGNFFSDKTSGVEQLPGLNAAKVFLTDSMKIPSIYDPNRTDTAFDTNKSKRKKVTFADEGNGPFLTFKEIEANESSAEKKEPKNSEKKGPVPRLNLTGNQFSHVARPPRPRKTSLLPPIKISQNEVRTNPSKVTDGVNEWKSMYCNIVDPEQRTRALTDILHAVRLKKFENEMAMKYGSNRPKLNEKEAIEDLMMASDKIVYRDEHGGKRQGYIPSPRSMASRLGHRSHAYQLQNYLRQMSRSRRILEHVEAEQRRLANISRSRALPDRNNPSPVSVKA